jgi:hypothetical protein
VRAVAGILALLALAGCVPEGSAAADAAQDFHEALAASSWSAACSLLQDDTREKVAEEQDSSCEDHVRSLDIQEPGEVNRTETYGRNAFVEFDNDTVFLTAVDSGWQVTAAGCTPNGDAPYTCEVGGK